MQAVGAEIVAEAYELVTQGELGDELASFTRAMRALNVSPNAISPTDSTPELGDPAETGMVPGGRGKSHHQGRNAGDPPYLNQLDGSGHGAPGCRASPGQPLVR